MSCEYCERKEKTTAGKEIKKLMNDLKAGKMKEKSLSEWLYDYGRKDKDFIKIEEISNELKQFIKEVLEEIENKDAKFGSYSIGKLGIGIAIRIIKQKAGGNLT